MAFVFFYWYLKKCLGKYRNRRTNLWIYVHTNRKERFLFLGHFTQQSCCLLQTTNWAFQTCICWLVLMDPFFLIGPEQNFVIFLLTHHLLISGKIIAVDYCARAVSFAVMSETVFKIKAWSYQIQTHRADLERSPSSSRTVTCSKSIYGIEGNDYL